ncbi:hypothetical protein DAY19_00025 [Halobacteriovorax vibrionivorans]|uniref:DUF2059 domain-containing protein n=1 Tax=Halobacteriovorax vibrionivorans TaxID=2152716 RepID=A0ABY0IGX1_9BACT|nr:MULTISPECIES: hypothetical protein [Halobacteriovorax]RZF22187.1 hypothetical protein DAY19_00025 [Halobacteriovorax vibrionivorans]TGD48439.1 hypothetical protein EP118_02940 [Halobacteriovorax sp. Y22]
MILKRYLKYILISFSLMLMSYQSFGSNMKEAYIKDLKAVKEIKGSGDNKLLTLIRKSSDELVDEWSPELAKELCRVYDKLLNVNQNYFLSELIGPVMKKRKKEFLPIFNKVVSKKNRELHKKLEEMVERETREGNG